MNKNMIKNILIVCTGNSCRSVMAEGYMKKTLKEHGKNIKVVSAGTGAMDGMTPPEETVEVMNEIGIGVSEHRSASVRVDMVKAADVILVMEPQNKEHILDIDRNANSKIFFMRDFDKGANSKNMPDPIGKGEAYYRDVLGIVKRSVEGFIKWLNT